MTKKSVRTTSKKDVTVVEELKCSDCDKHFKTEKGLINHICEQKNRRLWKDEKFSIVAFQAFNLFYRLKMFAKRDRTFEEFIKSKQYNGFIRFGKYIVEINAIKPRDFIVFLIKANVKLEEWRTERNYEIYLRELGKKEDPYSAIERNYLLMEQWGMETDEHWQDFFTKVNPQLATKWIKTGRISPWLLYTVGGKLLERLSEEQFNMIEELINPEYWNKKFALNKDAVKGIKEFANSIGLK